MTGMLELAASLLLHRLFGVPWLVVYLPLVVLVSAAHRLLLPRR
jgi:hypothetical protein